MYWNLILGLDFRPEEYEYKNLDLKTPSRPPEIWFLYKWWRTAIFNFYITEIWMLFSLGVWRRVVDPPSPLLFLRHNYVMYLSYVDVSFHSYLSVPTTVPSARD
jgi:hypothetical protein